ncbi:succinate dehydrogenase subunit 6, mitochondrial-like [Vicia villosa]|uniref:succinate dehydrogenase subunit 6, mitochondrial-like n=1 Tax=Vicia villosa TaxID=3911 RepID=UPI00273AA779|nr:succinate dehydrogenase subunit 6, mitochondrial-like [Vicia villosa]
MAKDHISTICIHWCWPLSCDEPICKSTTVSKLDTSNEGEDDSFEDPIYKFYGIVLDSKAKDEILQYATVGASLRHFSYTVVASTWMSSLSNSGAGLSLLAGGVFGWTFGHEIVNPSLQLYSMDTLASEAKFLEWWKRKTEGY